MTTYITYYNKSCVKTPIAVIEEDPIKILKDLFSEYRIHCFNGVYLFDSTGLQISEDEPWSPFPQTFEPTDDIEKKIKMARRSLEFSNEALRYSVFSTEGFIRAVFHNFGYLQKERDVYTSIFGAINK